MERFMADGCVNVVVVVVVVEVIVVMFVVVFVRRWSRLSRCMRSGRHGRRSTGSSRCRRCCLRIKIFVFVVKILEVSQCCHSPFQPITDLDDVSLPKLWNHL